MPTLAVISRKDLDYTLKLLETEVGPRHYWLHNKIGGANWTLDNHKDGYHLQINDQSKAIWILLKLQNNA